MKKLFLSFTGCLFIITVYAQNPVYTADQKRERVFNPDGGTPYIKINESELKLATGSEEPAQETDFRILSEGVSFSEFTPQELQIITANRQKKYAVKTFLGRKIILIAPAN
ncbi:MAG: hypothetical protein ACO1O6_08530 [Bacteroidota bacterium]